MVVFVALWISCAWAHGWMEYPPSRNFAHKASSKNQYGYMRVGSAETYTEYNAQSLVGHPPNEPTSIFPANACGSSVIAGQTTKMFYDKLDTSKFGPLKEPLTPGGDVKVKVHITANHIGPHWIEYACFDDGQLDMPTGDAQVEWKRLKLKDPISNNDAEELESTRKCKALGDPPVQCYLTVQVPDENCNHGVLRWVWRAKQKEPNEFFRNCADVKVGTGSGGSDKGSDTGPGGSGGESPSVGEGADEGTGQATPPKTTPSGTSQNSAEEEEEEDHTVTILLIVVGVLLVIAAVIAGVYISNKNSKERQRKEAQRMKKEQKATRAKKKKKEKRPNSTASKTTSANRE